MRAEETAIFCVAGLTAKGSHEKFRQPSPADLRVRGIWRFSDETDLVVTIDGGGHFVADPADFKWNLGGSPKTSLVQAATQNEPSAAARRRGTGPWASTTRGKQAS